MKPVWTRSTLAIFVLIGLGRGLTACTADEATTPEAWTYELVELSTDPTGTAHTMWLDNGTRYAISPSFGDLRPDTTYRVLAVYDKPSVPTSVVHVGRISSPICPLPEAIPADEMQCQPLAVQSAWFSGGYLNLMLRVPVFDANHVFGIHAAPIMTTAEGKVLPLQLFHSSNDTLRAFTQTAFLSCPLDVPSLGQPFANRPHYSDSLTVGDSVRVSYVNLTGQMQTMVFAFTPRHN